MYNNKGIVSCFSVSWEESWKEGRHDDKHGVGVDGVHGAHRHIHSQ